MPISHPRFLRPSLLALLPSGLWAIDEFHPVAAVLDPDTGHIRRVVSWREVPPPVFEPPDSFAFGPPPIVKADGTGLWIQYDLKKTLVRINEDGLSTVVYSHGLELSVVGPEVVWCAAWSSRPEIRDAYQASRDKGQLLRVERNGHTTLVTTDGRVEQLGTSVEGLLVKMAVPRRSDGRGSAVWLSLPWDDEIPDRLEFIEGVTPEAAGPTWYAAARPPWDGVAQTPPFWHEPALRGIGVTTDHHRWALGWWQNPTWPQPAEKQRSLLATAHTPDGTEIGRWELGRGQILSAKSLGDRLAVTIKRANEQSEVIALRPYTDEVSVLVATDALDIAKLGWPLVARPLAADSYVNQVREQAQRWLDFSRGEIYDVQTTLLGKWPETMLEWTFRWTDRPGVVLRHRVRLFDQLGRIYYPESAGLDLMEAVEGGGVPPAEYEVDGFIDL